MHTIDLRPHTLKTEDTNEINLAHQIEIYAHELLDLDLLNVHMHSS
jgi:hypothetical protein